MRLLIVEDEVRLAAYVKRGLEREGYAVDVAADGDEGYWLATTNPYDVILLDILLPGRNGYEVCSVLRNEGVWTPVLMLTAKNGEYDEAEALDTGADDFLSKPFSFVVLLARIRALVRRGGAGRPPVLEIGSLALDPAAGRFTVAGAEETLTPTEFCVIHQMMRHAGDVLSKRDILESCWDWAFDGDPNIVEVYVSHLRKKIRGGTDTRIETVRGAGYRLVVDDG